MCCSPHTVVHIFLTPWREKECDSFVTHHHVECCIGEFYESAFRFEASPVLNSNFRSTEGLPRQQELLSFQTDTLGKYVQQYIHFFLYIMFYILHIWCKIFHFVYQGLDTKQIRMSSYLILRSSNRFELSPSQKFWYTEVLPSEFGCVQKHVRDIKLLGLMFYKIMEKGKSVMWEKAFIVST